MQNFINEELIRELNQRIASIQSFPEMLLQSQQKYHTNLTQETPEGILELVRRINQREGKKGQTGKNKALSSEFWVFGQRKIFCWTLICYLAANDLKIESMDDKHFKDLQIIFPKKSMEFIRYQVTVIARAGSKYKDTWSEQEITLLTSIVEKKKEKYDWRHISFLLFIQSDCACFKPLQECREKWCNYINPNLKKDTWSLEEDYQLFQLIEKQGCRWAHIARKFNMNRTQHMVKNRYNAYIKIWKNKPCGVKSKKGLIHRILSYIKARINKKMKKDVLKTEYISNQISNQEEHPSSQESEEHNQYADPYQDTPQERQEHNGGRFSSEEQSFREAYIVEKNERRTADCDTPESPSINATDKMFDLESLQEIIHTKGNDFKNGQMRFIEDVLVEALGCKDVERALNPYDYDQFDEENLSGWLF